MLKTLKFSTEITANTDNLWFVLWNKAQYKMWTSAFSEGGSLAITDWQEGSYVHFVNNEGDGIFAKITENVKNQIMSFRHQGQVKNSIKQQVDPIWENALEQYVIKEINGKVRLEVNFESPADYVSFFEKTFPKALENIKNQTENLFINISAEILKPIEQVWEYYNTPEHIVNWNFAADTWHCPSSENNLKEGGNFKNTMAAKDGSFSFDFEGEYKKIEIHKYILYHIKGDNREVHIYFEKKAAKTLVTIKFQPESMNPLELQESGWQAILNNFKTYIEKN